MSAAIKIVGNHATPIWTGSWQYNDLLPSHDPLALGSIDAPELLPCGDHWVFHHASKGQDWCSIHAVTLRK